MAKFNRKTQLIIKRIEKAVLFPKFNKELIVKSFRKQYKLLGVECPKKIVWKKDLVLLIPYFHLMHLVQIFLKKVLSVEHELET